MKKSDILGKLLMLLISLFFVIMGLIAISTQYYYGETRKGVDREIILNGEPAVIMGCFLVFMGLIPVGVFLKNKKQLKYWVMTKESIKKNKSLEKAVVGNVTRSVNMASQWTLKNIYPKGQFGFIKPSEYQEILNVYGEIINTHKLNVSAKQITPALKFKADCKEYSKNNGTEEVSELKYRQVQATIDDFIDTIKKPLQVLKKDGSTQEFDISKVNKALEWATAKPKM